MIAKITTFVKKNSRDIFLLVVVFLVSLLSFSIGYITARMEQREPLSFEMPVYSDSEVE